MNLAFWAKIAGGVVSAAVVYHLLKPSDPLVVNVTLPKPDESPGPRPSHGGAFDADFPQQAQPQIILVNNGPGFQGLANRAFL